MYLGGGKLTGVLLERERNNRAYGEMLDGIVDVGGKRNSETGGKRECGRSVAGCGGRQEEAGDGLTIFLRTKGGFYACDLHR